MHINLWTEDFIIFCMTQRFDMTLDLMYVLFLQGKKGEESPATAAAASPEEVARLTAEVAKQVRGHSLLHISVHGMLLLAFEIGLCQIKIVQIDI